MVAGWGLEHLPLKSKGNNYKTYAMLKLVQAKGQWEFRFEFRFMRFPVLKLMPPVPLPQRCLSRSSAAFACFKLSLSCLSIAPKFAASLSKPRNAVMDSICD